MATSSVVGTVRSTFKAQLLARAGLSIVAISRYKPAVDDENAVDQIWFGDAGAVTEDAAPGSRFDDFELLIHIKARKPGGSEDAQAEAETRALELFAEVEAQILADRSIDGVCIDARLTRYETSFRVEHGNAVCELEANALFRTQLENS